MTDQNAADPFDGTNSYFTSYTSSWQTFTTQDLYMVLKTHVYFGGPTVSASPPTGTYNPSQSVTLTASAPGTVYYTTDGSTPTTSSTNGPSPVLLAINTNSTLKFFAKDASNNIGPTSSAAYTIVPLITVSSSLPNGTYNSIEPVTLTASAPGNNFLYH